MKNSLETFITGLADLQNHIHGLEIESRLLLAPVDENTSPLLVQLQGLASRLIGQRQIFNYNSVIISLYGFLEPFIESLISKYLNFINTIVPNYEELPEPIKKNHIELSFGLINRIQQARYSGTMTVAQVVSNIHACLNNPNHYQLNDEAFTYHTANFRADVIMETFARIGVENVSMRLKKCPTFTQYLTSLDENRDVEMMSLEEAFFYLNDLVERRNEVAHGARTELLPNDMLLSYLNFFKAYGQALYEVVQSETLSYETKYRGIPLGKPLKVWQKGTVVCLSVKNISIKVGDFLIAKISTLPYLKGEIQEIQINKISYNKSQATATEIIVCLKVTFKATKNQSFFLIPQ
ncbi:hypothetical protein PN36_04685 [Candidatus Thiomargarita nelsonii]|uniref:RiboL-PSP-HEPN domain-containing protein n=1 Tax=Candidatus Thiomargarita nelsonii TaxID=1003181 RepID=A0A0A6PHT0_9GAMM|nr:hypothetical protein PN36_04685 [Candidatus Thiomargarita nelsonii]